MAIPTPVNGQITDAVTQSSVAALASAPATAMSSIYQSSAHSISILYQNAVQAQMQSSISAQAATNQGVIQLYSTGTMSAATATSKLQQSDNSMNTLVMLLILKAFL